jgi:hypothetical protein
MDMPEKKKRDENDQCRQQNELNAHPLIQKISASIAQAVAVIHLLLNGCIVFDGKDGLPLLEDTSSTTFSGSLQKG